MKIGEIRKEVASGHARIAADVAWEDCARTPREIFFETEESLAEALVPSAEAFLAGCVVPAFRHGERRVRVEGAVCPELREGIRGALTVLAGWYGNGRRPVAIEAAAGFRPPPRRAPPRTAALLSGGLDSLFTLRMNLLEIPRDHPSAIRDGIVILGHDFGLPDSQPLELERFGQRTRSLSALAAACGIELVPMRFNLRDLDDDLDFYIGEQFGAALAAAGHALTGRISALTIPSSHDLGHLIPCGSHALLDPNYASGALAIRHDGASRTRFEKLAVVAAWPEALRRLAPCNRRPPHRDRINCGACEKCLRTATGLLALGRLAGAETFRESDVSPEALRTIGWVPGFEGYWAELVPALRAAGRNDLAEIIAEKVREALRFRDWREENDGKGLVKRFDRRYLGGSVASVLRRIRRAGSA